MRGNRLNTEELIQATRTHYDMSKYQERNQEIELTLQLRTKEVNYLSSQISSLKE